jgi:cytochrome c553
MGPSLTTVADRRDAAYIRAIIEDPQRVVRGAAMPKTLMPATTRDLVIRYLTRNARTGTPLPTAAAQSILTNPPSAGTRPSSILYQRWCASCHGQNGGGDGPNAKYLPVPPAIHNSAAQMSARSDDALFDAIAGGGAVMGKSVRMPAFGATLAPAEIRSLVAYIRALCACRGPTWSTDGSKR